MNIFVTKLGPNVSNADLLNMFSKFGEVTSAKLIMDRETGNSKGYGFVEMANDSEANAAIAALDNSDMDGRQIVVKEARPREEGGGNGGFQRRPYGGGGGGGRFNSGGGGGDRRGGGGGGYDRSGGSRFSNDRSSGGGDRRGGGGFDRNSGSRPNRGGGRGFDSFSDED
jgi:RNA recognition motif-containing protein